MFLEKCTEVSTKQCIYLRRFFFPDETILFVNELIQYETNFSTKVDHARKTCSDIQWTKVDYDLLTLLKYADIEARYMLPYNINRVHSCNIKWFFR